MLSTTRVRDDDRLTPSIQRYLRCPIVSMSMYASLLITSLFALRAIPDHARALRAAFALVLPLLLLVRAFARYVHEVDERQRQIRPQSVALATMTTGIGCMEAGFLACAGVFAVNGAAVATWVLPALFGADGLARA